MTDRSAKLDLYAAYLKSERAELQTLIERLKVSLQKCALKGVR
ncbi:hypothetical protein [Ligilactobacillus faecis]|nr:hypothetical protein [Ligilactobacillus faecis]WGN90475.1 hypothetical protein QFX10_05290 [Ligilactobacillus faecis]